MKDKAIIAKQDELIKEFQKLVNLCNAPQYHEVMRAKEVQNNYVHKLESELSALQAEDKVKCPDCNGFGKEICDNPDHGLISALSFHDIGRIGCPGCGHDEHHRMKANCEKCNGTGFIESPAEPVTLTEGILLELEHYNPYPESVFTPIPKRELRSMIKLLKDNGYSPDCLYGNWGRNVWNNCVLKAKELFKSTQ